MIKIKTLALISALTLASTAWANDEDENWFEITSTKDFKWHGQKASGSLTALDGKKDVAYRYILQETNNASRKLTYSQAAVTLTSCKQGYGYVIYNNMQGEFTRRAQYVRFGTTVTDHLGTAACAGWDQTTGKVSRAMEDDEWFMAARAKDGGDEFWVNTRTIKKTKYKSKPAISALSAFHEKKTGKTMYGVYAILQSDCKRGFGTIHEQDFDGKFVGSSDVSLQGNSLIAATANVICNGV